MVEYIIFEKGKIEKETLWTETKVFNFCKEQKLLVDDLIDETLFFVVRLVDAKKETVSYRMLEVSETITFIIADDKSLDEFLELDIGAAISSPEQASN